MNLPGHRIAACLGKAALKTHALQTLRDRRASPKRAERLECVRFISTYRPERYRQWFMVPMHAQKTKGMNLLVRITPASDSADDFILILILLILILIFLI